MPGTSLGRHRPQPYLFCFPCNEVPDGLAEEAGEEGVQGGLVVQEVVEDVEQGLVPAQFVVDLRHVRGEQLAGRVGVPAGTHPQVRWKLWDLPPAKVSGGEGIPAWQGGQALECWERWNI